MFQCKDILSLASMSKAEVIAGQGGMNRNIRWSYKAENINFEKWVHGEELLIVSSPVTQRKSYDLYQIIKKAIELNMSCALLLKGENYVEKIDEKVIQLAESENFPLFVIPWNVPLLDFFEELGHAISYLDNRKDIQDNILAEIIFGGDINSYKIENKCKEMGHNLSVLEQVFVMHMEGLTNDEIRSSSKILQDLFVKYEHEAIVSCYGNRMIGFMHNATKDREKIKQIFSEFDKFIRECYLNAEYTLSIGEKTNSLMELKNSFQNTSKINGLLKQIGRINEIVFYDQVGFYRLLMSFENKEPMKKYVNEVIGSIILYDENNHLSLIETMWNYFKSDGNLQKTADSLYVHKNTIKYRIQRIEEISGRDFRNCAQALEMYNALIIYYYLKYN